MGVCSFSAIRTSGQRYVDKTGYIKKLLEKTSKAFLSRPRRFGKSLLLSMLESFFRCETSLFEDLQVVRDPPVFSSKFPGTVWAKDVCPFPVIKLDFAGIKPESLEKGMISKMKTVGECYGVNINTDDASSAIESLVRLLANIQGNDYGQVVVLVDEYDSPIMRSMEFSDTQSTPTQAITAVQILSDFFATLKGLDDFIRFRFVTGVTKVAQALLCSGGADMEVRSLMPYDHSFPIADIMMACLQDITLWEDFSCLCGFTWDEIEGTFANELHVLGDINDTKKGIIRMYNGYCWAGSTKVLNPLSICSLLKPTGPKKLGDSVFKKFWVDTGRTGWLIRMMQEVEGRIPAADVWIQEDGFLSSIDIPLNSSNPQFEDQVRSLMFQAGYLTVKETKIVDNTKWLYITIPNDEVQNSLIPETWKSFFGRTILKDTLKEMAAALNHKNLQMFLDIMNSEINGIAWKAAQKAANYEGFYQSLILILLRQVKGLDISAEIQNISGQLDIRIVTNSMLFIFEIKQDPCKNERNVNEVLKSAIDQVFDHNYALGDRAACNHECCVVGLVFSTTSRLAAAFQVQKFTIINKRVRKQGKPEKIVYLAGMTAPPGNVLKRTFQARQDSEAERPSKKGK